MRFWFFWMLACKKRVAAQTTCLIRRFMNMWMMIGAATAAMPKRSNGLRKAIYPYRCCLVAR